MRRARASLVAASALIGAAAIAGLASADDPEPVLHKYVAPPEPGARSVDPTRPQLIGESDPDQNPVAIRHEGQLLPEPSAIAPPAADELLFGSGAWGTDRDTAASLDRSTGADSRLNYTEVFDPSVVPFKRMSAFDAVAPNYELVVAESAHLPVPVGGARDPARDPFWGSIAVLLEPGKDVPIPSVSADMAILSVESTPPTDLAFSKDSADNYFVRRVGAPGPARVTRIVFLAAAPASYFGSELPRGYKLRDAAKGVRLPPLPRDAAPAAREVAQRLGLSSEMPLEQGVDKLVAYFRSFDAGPAPDTGDIYKDLTFSQRGVCRHRSFAFVVTALGLGLPARMVTNEAHAFVEIHVPERGWLRVDLGGEASALDVANANKKAIHRPRAPDPFPKPSTYTEGGMQLAGADDVSGLTQAQIDATKRGNGGGNGTGGNGGNGNGGSGGNGSGGNGSDDPTNGGTAMRGLPEPVHRPDLPETRLTVDEAEDAAYRGDRAHVRGKARSQGAGAANLRVDLYLAPLGGGGDGARFVGQTVTDPDGNFVLEIELPSDLELGPHEVFASTPGDGAHAPALSE